MRLKELQPSLGLVERKNRKIENPLEQIIK